MKSYQLWIQVLLAAALALNGVVHAGQSMTSGDWVLAATAAVIAAGNTAVAFFSTAPPAK